MQVETLEIKTLPDADALAIAELLVRVWPKSEKTLELRLRELLELGSDYRGPDELTPRSFLIRDRDEVIAHAAIIPRSIGTLGGDMTIAGLTRVCTDPKIRGKGLGEVIVQAVFALVDDQTFPFSLFQTDQQVRPFYEKLGSCVVENPIVNSLSEDKRSSPFWDKVIMRYPCSGPWPEGEIDLRGPGY